MINPVGWFEICVADISSAQKFYETVLGTTLDSVQDSNDPQKQIRSFPSSMESYGAPGALIEMKDMPMGHNSVVVYFNCEDCAVEEARVVEAGGEIERSKFSIGEHGFVCLAKDTEGNLFGLHSMK